MKTPAARLARDALALAPEQRAELAELLWESVADPAAVERRIAAEALDRVQAVEEGRMPVVPAERLLGEKP